jgi:biotin carboxylase
VLRIWFNRTYSTNIHTIALLRDNPSDEPVQIFATHADPSSPVMSSADVTEPEPGDAVVADEYVVWALDFCERHAIDVFIPRLHLETIAAARNLFEAAGVAVVAGPPAAAGLLEDKAAAYDDAREAGLSVPPFRVVLTGDELMSAHTNLTAEVGKVCLKPVTGVGGEGFRILTTERAGLSSILGPLQPHVHIDDVAQAIDARRASGGTVPPMMVLPYLPGPEVSVDCLADEAGRLLAAIPRTKMSRMRFLVDDTAAIDIARTIVSRHKLSSLSNTQVRYWAHPGKDAKPLPYLLETNPRISGGLYQTALSGLNLPWAAVELALGRELDLPVPVLGHTYTTVSALVTIKTIHSAAPTK